MPEPTTIREQGVTVNIECTCAGTPPTMPTCRNTNDHLPNCPAYAFTRGWIEGRQALTSEMSARYLKLKSAAAPDPGVPANPANEEHP